VRCIHEHREEEKDDGKSQKSDGKDIDEKTPSSEMIRSRDKYVLPSVYHLSDNGQKITNV